MAELAARADDALLHAERRDLLHGARDRRGHRLAIVGMDATDERLERRLERCGLDAVDAVQLVAPADAILDDVPLEAADVRDSLRLVELADPPLELGGVPPELVVQARLLDRRRRVRRHRFGPVDVLLAERGFLALDDADADYLAAGAHGRPSQLPPSPSRTTFLECPPDERVLVLVHERARVV